MTPFGRWPGHRDAVVVSAVRRQPTTRLSGRHGPGRPGRAGRV